MSAPVRVVVADDHPLVLEGLAAVLETMPDMALLASARTGREAVEAARAHDAELVVMDLGMPELDGIEATRLLLAERPDTRVLVLTMQEDDDSLYGALRAGARGYLLKGAPHAEVAAALRTVAAGEAVFGAGVAERILAHFGARPTAPPDPFPELTEREREVLELLAGGAGTKEIARRLYLSPKTVRNNVAAILRKLQVADRAQAIAHARRAGLPRDRRG